MKINEERSVYNPINKDVLIHRFYGAISFQDNLYRIKTTILENKDYSVPNKPHSFEVIKNLKIINLIISTCTKLSPSCHPVDN